MRALDRYTVSTRSPSATRLVTAFVRSAFLALHGGSGTRWPPVDVVIHDRATATVVNLIPASGRDETAELLARIEHDLRELSVPEFADKWAATLRS